jgi:hypothetical protein
MRIRCITKGHSFSVSFTVDSADLGSTLAALDPVPINNLSVRLCASEPSAAPPRPPDSRASSRRVKGLTERERDYMAIFTEVGQQATTGSMWAAADKRSGARTAYPHNHLIRKLVEPGFTKPVSKGVYECLKLPEPTP